jgi:hypothetical protein
MVRRGVPLSKRSSVTPARGYGAAPLFADISRLSGIADEAKPDLLETAVVTWPAVGVLETFEPTGL